MAGVRACAHASDQGLTASLSAAPCSSDPALFDTLPASPDTAAHRTPPPPPTFAWVCSTLVAALACRASLGVWLLQRGGAARSERRRGARAQHSTAQCLQLTLSESCPGLTLACSKEQNARESVWARALDGGKNKVHGRG